MQGKHVFTTIATELPGICRQLESSDVKLHAAALNRLHDFCRMTAPWRGALGRQTSRRSVLRGVATFAAMSLKPDD